MRLSTADAICRRRAPSRRQVHCAPPFDCEPDWFVFPRTNLDTTFTSRFVLEKNPPFPLHVERTFPFRSLIIVAASMWCCKRLDASDWPVTTIVRGNASFLHVANLETSFPSRQTCIVRVLAFHQRFIQLPRSITLSSYFVCQESWPTRASNNQRFSVTIRLNRAQRTRRILHRRLFRVSLSRLCRTIPEALHERCSFHAGCTRLLLLYSIRSKSRM